MALTKEDLQQIQSILQLTLQPIVERLDKLEAKVDKLEAKVDKLDKRLGYVEFTVENLTKDVDKIKKLEGL